MSTTERERVLGQLAQCVDTENLAINVGWLRGILQEADARVRELELRRGCECKCCPHGEVSDCACDCHAHGRCAHVMQPNGSGTLMVGTKDWQVVVELPRDMTGHVVFSPQQARDLAATLCRQAAAVDPDPPGALVFARVEPGATVCPACVMGNPPDLNVRLCETHAAMAGARLDLTNHHSALACPYCNPHGLRLQEPEKQREGDQRLPDAVGGPAMQDLLIADVEARKAVGLRRYGQLLKAHDGRDNLRDIYEEIMDAAVYLRKALYERDGR